MTGDTMRHLPTNDGDNGSGSHVERDGQRMKKSYTVQNESEIMEGETLKSSHGRSVGRSCLLQQKMQECMDIVAAVNGEVDKAERDYRRTRNHLTQIQMNVNRFHSVLGEMEEKESTIAGVIKDLEMRMQQGEEEKARLGETADGLKQKILGAEREAEVARQQKEKADLEMQEYASMLKDKDALIEKLQEDTAHQLSEKEQKIGTLESQLEQQAQRLVEIQECLEKERESTLDAQAMRDTIERDLDELQVAIRTLQEQKDAVQVELQQERESLAKKEREWAAKEALLQARQQELEKMTATTKDLQEALRARELENINLVKETKHVCQCFEEEKETHHKLVDEMKEQKLELQASHRQVQKNLEDQIKFLQNQLHASKEEWSATQTRLAKEISDIQKVALEERKSLSLAHLKELEITKNAVEENRDMLKKYQAHVNDLQSEQSKLLLSSKDKDDMISHQGERIQELKLQLDKMDCETLRLRATEEQSAKQIQFLQDHISSLSDLFKKKQEAHKEHQKIPDLKTPGYTGASSKERSAPQSDDIHNSLDKRRSHFQDLQDDQGKEDGWNMQSKTKGELETELSKTKKQIRSREILDDSTLRKRLNRRLRATKSSKEEVHNREEKDCSNRLFAALLDS